jgi:hypothetical protein
VKGLVEAGLLTGLPESLLAGRQAARGAGRDRIELDCPHTSQDARSARPGVAW